MFSVVCNQSKSAPRLKSLVLMMHILWLRGCGCYWDHKARKLIRTSSTRKTSPLSSLKEKVRRFQASKLVIWTFDISFSQTKLSRAIYLLSIYQLWKWSANLCQNPTIKSFQNSYKLNMGYEFVLPQYAVTTGVWWKNCTLMENLEIILPDLYDWWTKIQLTILLYGPPIGGSYE